VYTCSNNTELELELIQTQMAQKPVLRAEVGMRVRIKDIESYLVVFVVLKWRGIFFVPRNPYLGS